MQYAIIVDETVVNVAASEKPLADNWVVLEPGFGIGDRHDGQVYSRPLVTVEALSAAAQAALLKIDSQAEQQRLRFITGGAGQALEYEETAKELARLRLDVSPDPDNYPYLMADQGILGETLADVAANLDQLLSTWRTVGPIIKRIRRQAKAAVIAAQDQGDITAINDASVVDWSEIDAAIN